MNKINVNGINIAYERRGSGAPLVLLHGYPLDHSIWNEAMALLENDFDVLAPDLRGFGESDSVEAQYTIADIAKDMADLLEALGIKQTYIAGHSMGGYVALAFARTYPERVLGLGLISSQALADAPERKEGRYAAAKQVAEQGVNIIVDSMAEKLTARADLVSPLKALIARQHPRGIIGALKAMAERADSTPYLSSCHFPVVLIHGDTDVLIPIDRTREIKDAVPHAHLIEIPGAGHMPMMENPQQVANALMNLKE